jgi:hypothetical protein
MATSEITASNPLHVNLCTAFRSCMRAFGTLADVKAYARKHGNAGYVTAYGGFRLYYMDKGHLRQKTWSHAVSHADVYRKADSQTWEATTDKGKAFFAQHFGHGAIAVTDPQPQDSFCKAMTKAGVAFAL